MAEEGAVIGCHSVDEWKQHLLQANESKKLVNALAFLLVLFPIPLVGSRFFFWISFSFAIYMPSMWSCYRINGPFSCFRLDLYDLFSSSLSD